jgi:hypothetical protein
MRERWPRPPAENFCHQSAPAVAAACATTNPCAHKRHNPPHRPPAPSRRGSHRTWLWRGGGGYLSVRLIPTPQNPRVSLCPRPIGASSLVEPTPPPPRLLLCWAGGRASRSASPPRRRRARAPHARSLAPSAICLCLPVCRSCSVTRAGAVRSLAFRDPLAVEGLLARFWCFSCLVFGFRLWERAFSDSPSRPGRALIEPFSPPHPPTTTSQDPSPRFLIVVAVAIVSSR